MSEDQSIHDESKKEEVNENISREGPIAFVQTKQSETPKAEGLSADEAGIENTASQQSVELTQPKTSNIEPQTSNMEVHHHHDLHHKKKHWKEYFLEFLMMFLAVSLGFMSENLRENVTNHEKEKHYIESIMADLRKDTANITLGIHMQHLLVKKMENVLNIPVKKLDDLSWQDTLYQSLVPFYASFWIFVQYNNTVTQLKNAAGFSVFSNQKVVDSISDVYYYYDTWIKINSDLYIKSYEKTDDLAVQLLSLPESIYSFDDTTRIATPLNAKILLRYDTILLEQLYSNIRFQKGELIVCIETEEEYFGKVERLLKLLQSEYHLK